MTTITNPEPKDETPAYLLAKKVAAETSTALMRAIKKQAQKIDPDSEDAAKNIRLLAEAFDDAQLW